MAYESFWRLVDKSGDCWVWLGSKDRNGYGHSSLRDEQNHRYGIMAHRKAYVLLVGPVPDGLVLDHLCRNPSCVNPAHLEPVTQRENLMRSPTFQRDNALKTECVNGHPFDDANTYQRERNGSPHRECITCRREAVSRHYKRSRERAVQ
jgi:hypothetical protein